MSQRASDIATLALNIDRLMRRIHAEIHPKAADFDQHNVGPLGGMLLLTIADHEPVDMRTVCDVLGRDKSQVSRLIKRIEGQGLIAREKSTSDGRATRLTLTAVGRHQLEDIQAALTSTIGDILGPLSAAEKKEFGRVLAKVTSVPI